MQNPNQPTDQKPRINTMEQLAKAIGVSRPTLSRFFQDPERVSKTSRRRIEKGLKEVEYVPNFFATRLNRKSKGMIGVIIPYLNDLFFNKLLAAIERAAMEDGFTVITQFSHSEPLIEARAAETFMSMSVDGVIVAPLGYQSDLHAHERLRSRMPFILVDSRPKTMQDVDFVGSDHMQSTGLATEYLCRVGSPPVFLAMPRVNFNALEREQAYIAKMEQLGHAPRIIGTETRYGAGDFEEHGQGVLEEEFAAGRLLDSSILCANDRIGIGALRAAASHGLQPGSTRTGGLRIMGHDDYPLCPFTVPSLTTVEQNLEVIGSTAVARLIEAIHAQNNQREQFVRLVEGALKIRESA